MKSDSQATRPVAESVMRTNISEIMSMIFAWFWGESSQAEISMACCSEPTCLLEKKSLLRYHSIFKQRVTREGFLAILELSEEEVYIVTPVVVAAWLAAAVVAAAVVAAAVVVAAVVAAAVVAAAVRPAAAVVRLRLVAATPLKSLNRDKVKRQKSWRNRNCAIHRQQQLILHKELTTQRESHGQ